MSTLKVNTIQDTSGNTQYTAKAWVNFQGTGTVAIRASGNVSSVSDLGTGYYQINFSSSLADANYSMAGMAARPDHSNGDQTCSLPGSASGKTASSCRVHTSLISSFNLWDSHTAVFTFFR
jgi:hypothetical protein